MSLFHRVCSSSCSLISSCANYGLSHSLPARVGKMRWRRIVHKPFSPEVVDNYSSAGVSISSCNTSLDKLAIRVSPLLTGFRYTQGVRYPTVKTGACPRPGEVEAVSRAPLILIIEEQPAIQELLSWMLHLAGCRTTVCVGRHAALIWREQTLPGDGPALLLLDVSLLNTHEASDYLCRLRAKWQDASGVLPQVIVPTTNTQIRAELRAREHVLLKPFSVREVLALIRRVILTASRSAESSSHEAYTPDL